MSSKNLCSQAAIAAAGGIYQHHQDIVHSGLLSCTCCCLAWTGCSHQGCCQQGCQCCTAAPEAPCLRAHLSKVGLDKLAEHVAASAWCSSRGGRVCCPAANQLAIPADQQQQIVQSPGSRDGIHKETVRMEVYSWRLDGQTQGFASHTPWR